MIAYPARPEDRIATIDGNILAVVARHGGERIVAGQQMEALVRELRELFLEMTSAEVRP